MNKLLIVVDYQNDFVDGSLGFEKAVELDELIAAKISEYRKNNSDIIFTKDTHDEDYLNTHEGLNLPVMHCIKNTVGHELYGTVRENFLSTDLVFEKNTFPSLELANYLKNTNYQEVEVCGLVSNICVLTNVVMVKSALPNAKIVVDYKLTASFDEELNNKTFDILKGIHIEVKNYE